MHITICLLYQSFFVGRNLTAKVEPPYIVALGWSHRLGRAKVTPPANARCWQTSHIEPWIWKSERTVDYKLNQATCFTACTSRASHVTPFMSYRICMCMGIRTYVYMCCKCICIYLQYIQYTIRFALSSFCSSHLELYHAAESLCKLCKHVAYNLSAYHSICTSDHTNCKCKQCPQNAIIFRARKTTHEQCSTLLPVCRNWSHPHLILIQRWFTLGRPALSRLLVAGIFSAFWT